MFDVICISISTIALNDAREPIPFEGDNVVVGNYYCVVEEIQYEDGVYYQLAEIPHPDIFHCDLFARISEIDEQELVNTKEEVC